ncbi:MAG TPA: ABC transporter ATP-binding protein [Acidimicrobiales bacterium]|nr:ABC transporter ATP-binding protein [Acidimicrobiales bacterium]
MTATAMRGRRTPGELVVSDLSISIERQGHRLTVVDAVSFAVAAGGSFGIVGESGSGKSLTLRALMGLLPPRVRVESGEIELDGERLPSAGRGAGRTRRGRVAMIFQDPLGALDPVYTVGAQVAEVPRRVLGRSRRESRERAIELFRLVGLPDPVGRAASYPHQLSGGMRQRVLIAMALAAEPAVLLCDEPTTALDVTVQAQVLELLDDLRRRLGLTVVFVSHDLAVVRQVCEETAVMYTGRLLEVGPTGELLDGPAHPYTRALLDAVVDLDDPIGAARAIPGSLPDPAEVPAGCPFHPRCAVASEDCARTAVTLRALTAAGPPPPAGSAGPPRPAGSAGPPPPARPGRSTACLHPERVLPHAVTVVTAAAMPAGR